MTHGRPANRKGDFTLGRHFYQIKETNEVLILVAHFAAHVAPVKRSISCLGPDKSTPAITSRPTSGPLGSSVTRRISAGAPTRTATRERPNRE